MKHVLPIAVLVVGGMLLMGVDLPTPAKRDAVSDAFHVYNILWRDRAAMAATGLTDGRLTTDAEVHQFLATANRMARVGAFTPIAEAEQAALGDEWTAEKHAELLRGYQ